MKNSTVLRMRTNRVPNQPHKNLQSFAKVAVDIVGQIKKEKVILFLLPSKPITNLAIAHCLVILRVLNSVKLKLETLKPGKQVQHKTNSILHTKLRLRREFQILILILIQSRSNWNFKNHRTSTFYCFSVIK